MNWDGLSPSECARLKRVLSPPVVVPLCTDGNGAGDADDAVIIRVLRSSPIEAERVRQMFVMGQMEYHVRPFPIFPFASFLLQ